MPVWRPTPQSVARSNLGRLMKERGLAGYAELHRWSVEHRAAFWGDTLRRLGIVWRSEPEAVRGDETDAEHPGWARGARLNIVDSCFREAHDAPAIVFASENAPEPVAVSRARLRRLGERVASGLRGIGCRPGDGVALYMPLSVECVAAYLGVIRAGCRVVSIADSFSAEELGRRLSLVPARAIVTVERFRRGDKWIPMLEKVHAANGPRAVVVDADRGALRDDDLAWADFLGPDEPFEALAADPADPINVLFSSGTTGTPKAIPWTHLTPIKCAADGHYHQDIREDDVVAWPTNIGWMMGPWLIFAALVNGATIALFEGAPGGAPFVRFVEHAGVTMLGVVPSLVRAWRALAPWPADWSRVRVLSSTGEPSNREDYLWLMSRTAYLAPVIEYCGGTEVGGGYLTGTVVQPASPATFTTPALGLDVEILDERGEAVGEGEDGEAFLVPPSVGLSETLLHQDHHEAYYADVPRSRSGRTLRRHGDRVTRLARGYYRSAGRADDTMNLGGIKVGALEIERVLEGHDAVRACAACGVQRGGEGAERLVVWFVAREPGGVDIGSLRREMNALLASRLNPLFRLHDLVPVDALPYTASNKLMRRALKAGYASREDAE